MALKILTGLMVMVGAAGVAVTPSPEASPSLVDCSEAYGGKPSRCERIAPPEKYRDFLGTWEGPFEAYDRTLKAFRPYRNRVSYSAADCLRNVQTGDVFIIGRKFDSYPSYRSQAARTAKGLLITGQLAGDQQRPFLRTVDEEGVNTYERVYVNDPAELSIWRLNVPAAAGQPAMAFTVIDGRDLTDATANKRLVTVTMALGPADRPMWQGVVAKGYHSLTPTSR
jgi:hypothetical protein